MIIVIIIFIVSSKRSSALSHGAYCSYLIIAISIYFIEPKELNLLWRMLLGHVSEWLIYMRYLSYYPTTNNLPLLSLLLSLLHRLCFACT